MGKTGNSVRNHIKAGFNFQPCCESLTLSADNQPACLPVSLPSDETHFNRMSRMENPLLAHSRQEGGEEEEGEPQHCDPEALDFVRSIPFCGLSFLERDQMNVVTAYVDASNVYGSTPEVASALREGSCGLLKTSANDLLPLMAVGTPDDGLTAGDPRARDMPGLASMHTIWLREHNRIAGLLKTDLGMSDDEAIYQLARRIVGAEMQNVVYGQWLTVVLGEQTMEDHGLDLNQQSSYDPGVDASIFNSFATAAFR